MAVATPSDELKTIWTRKISCPELGIFVEFIMLRTKKKKKKERLIAFNIINET